MFGPTIAFLKLIWPFLKESMLEDGTIKDWVKRQWTTFIWILFLITMLLITLYLADIIRILRTANIQKNQVIVELNIEKKQLHLSQRRLTGELQSARESNQRMRRYILDQCRTDTNSCHFLIDETVIRPNDPASSAQSEQMTDEWCLLVRGDDLKDASIRQRFLLECDVKVSDIPAT